MVEVKWHLGAEGPFASRMVFLAAGVGERECLEFGQGRGYEGRLAEAGKRLRKVFRDRGRPDGSTSWRLPPGEKPERISTVLI